MQYDFGDSQHCGARQAVAAGASQQRSGPPNAELATPWFKRRSGSRRLVRVATQVALLVIYAAACIGCGKAPVQPAKQQESASAVAITANPAGPIIIKTATAEFHILPTGYTQAYLVKSGTRLSVDEPEQGGTADGDYLVSAGKKVGSFQLDLAHAKVLDASGNLGVHGKRVEVTGSVSTAEGAQLEKTLAVEVYDDFPNLAITALTYKNTGDREFKLDQVVAETHRLNAALADPKVAPYNFWSFHGSSYEWGKDDVLPLSASFHQANAIGGPGPQGLGGGIPMVDFWTATVGVAIGHIEPLPLVLSLPVRVDQDGRVRISMALEPRTVLKPGEVYSAPHSFVAVHSGDYYEPLEMWSRAVRSQGNWSLAKATAQSYEANWCGWGYESDFTPDQMLSTLPKVKELGIKWATLDLRWFDNYGDWMPRSDTFPGDSIKKVVDEYHRQGIRMQLWYQPLSAEDGVGRHGLPKPMATSRVIEEHPDWAILDKAGRRARLLSPVSTAAAMCPALPEVQQYHKRLVERFLRDWGYDGLKMDSVYTVPPCYNPKHHHKSPEDSIKAMGQVFKVIFETARQIKPDSIIQICPCGTVPNLAWVFFQDQPVTADPVGGAQVRRRIKMYKAVLGPQAAVYGDHVELSEMRQAGSSTNAVTWVETGRDFASTVGPGGVIGTKFTWPSGPPRPRYRDVQLTAEKESIWRKWIEIYNSKMLARGVFLNLYTIGYDVPEGYSIEKDGKMYYAFFMPEDAATWKGAIELRGLKPGRYRVFDYVNGKNLGTVNAESPKLNAEFANHLLLEVSKL
jgi:alpha-galactosidase